ncbi:hypothetical protein CEXT_194831 [Caerostris extrusa]|uniref:Uncharacterized protein n=1 Tax=Caerostris extrusa TaxID=172846 RepID=A0AAV4VZR2_CAEEX|nr:hypothetical protein CEXT_194831 [Caerostris extrusa]
MECDSVRFIGGCERKVDFVEREKLVLPQMCSAACSKGRTIDGYHKRSIHLNRIVLRASMLAELSFSREVLFEDACRKCLVLWEAEKCAADVQAARRSRDN